MTLNFFSDKVKKHWHTDEVDHIDARGGVSANFRGVEKFFRGWRVVIAVLMLVMLVSAFREIIQDEVTPTGGLFGVAVIALSYYIYYRLWLEEQKTIAFLLWVNSHRHELEGGVSLVYDGCQVSLKTNVRQFEACLSLILFTIRFSSRHLFSDKDQIPVIGILYTLYTMVFGWWGIPWGPIFTFKAIVHNAVGGQKTTIEKIIQDLDKENNKK